MILARFEKTGSNLSFWFEDDGRVAYAYLQRDGRIVADVWVYNRDETPTVPEWKIGRRPPYLNVLGDIAENLPFTLPRTERDVTVHWVIEGAELFLGNRIAALLHDGDKPGFAAAAIRDNPIARAM